MFCAHFTYNFVHFLCADLVPWNNTGNKETHEFLTRLTAILLEFIDKTNDRNEKVLDFHYPDQLLEVFDFTLPDDPQNLDQLLTDCKDTLKYQVKTGKNSSFSIPFFIIHISYSYFTFNDFTFLHQNFTSTLKKICSLFSDPFFGNVVYCKIGYLLKFSLITAAPLFNTLFIESSVIQSYFWEVGN